jgi:hypothetical protein
MRAPVSRVHFGDSTAQFLHLFAICNQFGSKLDAIWIIHIEQCDGCSADAREAYNQNACHSKVGIPRISSWIEEWRQFASRGIDRGKVGPLVSVTAATCEREIRKIVAAAVLPRTNVLDMKSSPGESMLGDVTILTSVLGALPHELAELLVHFYAPPSRRRTALAFACRMPMKSMTWT